MNVRSRLESCIASASLLLIAMPSSATYQVYCGTSQSQVTSISSVFGEARPSSAPGFRYRFHTGVDLPAQCPDGTSVKAIKAGTVQFVPECATSDQDKCRRVLAADGTTFDYIHLDPTTVISTGGSVGFGAFVGTVLNGPLHLAETYTLGGTRYAINPQRTGALDFIDNDTIATKLLTVGPVTDSVIPIVESALDEDGVQTSTVPFLKMNNTYFIKGDADVLLTASGKPGSCGSSCRKGLFIYGYEILGGGPPLQLLKSGLSNIASWTIYDDQNHAKDGTDIVFFSRNDSSITDFASNMKINGNPAYQAGDDTWDTTAGPNGAVRICGRIKNFPGPDGTELIDCVDGVVDNLPPTVTFTDTGGNPFSNATSSTSIIVVGNDPVSASGVYTVNLVGPSLNQTSTNTSVTQSYSATFSSLADGQYTATVTDLAGNSASNTFVVDTSGPNGSNADGNGSSLPGNTMPNDGCLVASADSVAGVRSISISGPSYGPIATSFNCPDKATVGPFCGLAAGNYTITINDCAGNTNHTPDVVSVTTGAVFVSMTAVSPTLAQSATFYPTASQLVQGVSTMSIGAYYVVSNPSLACEQMKTDFPGSGPPCGPTPGGGAGQYFENSGIVSGGFSVTNVSTSTAGWGLVIAYHVADVGHTLGPGAQINFADFQYDLSPGQSLSLSINSSPANQPRPNTSPDGVASSTPTYKHVTISSCTPTSNIFQQLVAELLVAVNPSWNPYCWIGSEAVYISSVPMGFSFQGRTDVVIDTTTLGIYGFDIPSGRWTRDVVANQSVSVSSTGYVIARGSFTRTGTYSVYFVGHDTTAPVTVFSIQGSSSVFDQTLLVSTDSFIVLTATDPAVNGFASTVSTITYRFDPNPGDPFLVYTSSIPAPLGTHVIEFQSYDYAGNTETVKTATFTVTPGTIFRDSSDNSVVGGLLVGFLGSGPRAEVVVRAQDNLTLQISSVSHQALLAVSNIGSVGVGLPNPAAQLDVSSGAIALQLRSGNLTSTGTSVQAAFGYNGDVAMRHALETFHSTATVGNEMDFLVWTPDAGSTTTIATSKMLALQAITTASEGSVHVVPVGLADVELEVSNGVTTGGGTMQRLQVLTPSSRRFKSDIKYLDRKAEDRALEETAALKHVRYRYKARTAGGRLVDNPRQPEHVGLIYEDAPDSLKGADKTISEVERLANVELALRAAIRRLEELQKRCDALKKRGSAK